MRNRRFTNCQTIINNINALENQYILDVDSILGSRFFKKANIELSQKDWFERRLTNTLKNMSNGPQKFNSLASHKLKTPKSSSNKWSSTISGDYRIVWRYGLRANRIVLLDIVDHDEPSY